MGSHAGGSVSIRQTCAAARVNIDSINAVSVFINFGNELTLRYSIRMKTIVSCPLWVATLLVSAVVLTGVAAEDTHQVVNAPGFRPASKLADKFIEQLDSSRIAALPTVIRTRTATTFSEASQKAVVAFLKERRLGVPEARKVKLDMGELKGNAQFEMFQTDQAKLGEMVKNQSDADYFVGLECLIPKSPAGDISIFGLHIYVLDAKGENAFSFLLNSHHQIFADAGLKSADSSERGFEALVLKGTQVALDALAEQIKQARPNKSR